jgi:hypothetical protein
MLGGLQRNNLEGDMEIDVLDEDDKDAEQEMSKKKNNRKLKFTESDGLKTLLQPKDHTLFNLESQFTSDPLFKQKTKMFDDSSVGSLLMNNLSYTQTLML